MTVWPLFASRDMAPKLRRAAGFDSRHRFQWPRAHMPGVGLAPQEDPRLRKMSSATSSTGRGMAGA